MSDKAGVRVDKWLWAARFYKTRSLAKKAIEGGKVHVNKQRIKVSKVIEVGALLSLQIGWDEREIEVKQVSDQRRGAADAQLLYEETPASLARRAARAAERKTFGSQGISDHRPSTKERRQRERFLRSVTQEDSEEHEQE